VRLPLPVALAVVLLAAPAVGDELPKLADFGLKGQALFKTFVHFEQAPNDHQQVVDEWALQLEWERRLGTWGTAKIVGEFRDDDFGFTRGLDFQIPETTRQRSYLNLREATLRARDGPFELTLGKQIFAWGTADAYNPTDLLNPYDYLDVLDNEKIGVWSAAARAAAGPTSLTFAVVPFFTPSRAPLFRSRWTPVPPASFQTVVDDPVLPDQDASATQYAARLKSTFAGFDASVSYYDGFLHTEVFRQAAPIVTPGGVFQHLTPVYTRVKVPGADFSTTIGRFELHTEIAAFFVESNGRNDRFQTISGINYTQDFGWKWFEQLIVVIEYARQTTLRLVDARIVPSEGLPLVGDLLSDQAFRNAPIGRIQAKLTEDTVVKLSGIADLSSTRSYYLQLKAMHRITDAFHVEGGLDFLSGTSETFYGRWGHNDRFFLMLRYLF